MRTFLKRTVVFSLYFGLLLVGLQALISLRIRNKAVSGHDNLALTSGVNADLVFLGSSRCWAHFDPKFFDSAYRLKSINIGVDGHSEITMAIVRLQIYLLTNKAPKIAILSFDPFVRTGSLTHNGNFIHKDDFARYAFLPAKDERLLVDYFQYDSWEQYAPLYAIFKYHLLGSMVLLNNQDAWVQYGYDRHTEKWDTTLHSLRDTTNSIYSGLQDSTGIGKSLERLDSLCRHNNIRLLCVQTPVYKTIYDERAFTETKHICEMLHIPFVDADRESIRDDFDSFYNSYHLNRKGVERLNDYLRGDSLFNACMAAITQR